MAEDQKYLAARVEREDYLRAILDSSSPKRIVVAGPGTGKTYLFKRIVEGKPRSLALTFVNSLVEDLSLELAGSCEVRTLHGFARGCLRRLRGGDIPLFPKFTSVLERDAEILLGRRLGLDKAFHERSLDPAASAFYKERHTFYEEFFGYADIVFATVEELEKSPDKTPAYDQVIVDEFQDFNKLEVSLIEALAAKNPVLLAGDDDQALYDFKSASTDHIREFYDPVRKGFEPFTLPFCSRCTRVIVQAVNDVLRSGKGLGHLVGRIPKDYRYFEDQEKDGDSEKYSRIGFKQCYAAQIPWFIENHISEYAEATKAPFDVLVICPTTTQCRTVSEALSRKGFRNVDYTGRRNDELALIDGMKLLLDNKNCNLGWRIVAEFLLEEEEFEKFVAKSASQAAVAMHVLMPREAKVRANEMLKCLRAVRDGKQYDGRVLSEILAGTEHDPIPRAAVAVREELDGRKAIGRVGVRNVPIKVTTVQSAKGLAKDIVFVAYFDDQYFVGDKAKGVADRDIYRFLVAITRARRKLVLVSSRQEAPTFLTWIEKARIEAL